MDKLRQMLADDMKSGVNVSDNGSDGLDIPSGVYGTHDGRLVVMAKSIKIALEKASMAYDDSIMNLDYEIIDPGKKGYFGFGGKPCKIVVGRSDIKFGDLKGMLLVLLMQMLLLIILFHKMLMVMLRLLCVNPVFLLLFFLL